MTKAPWIVSSGAASVCAIVAILTLAQTPRALAQSTDNQAQQLFDEARALMKQGDYANACPKLAESQARDPAGGTVLNLAICHERLGLTATAFAELTQALSWAEQAGRKDRIRTARKHLDLLRPLLSYVTLQFPAEFARDGLAVEVDAIQLESPVDGFRIPLDPGQHELRVAAPGHLPWSARFELAAAADQKVIAIPALEPEPAQVDAPPPQQTPAPAFAAPASIAQALDVTPHFEQPIVSRWPGYLALVGGAAALAVGAYGGGRALSLKAKSDRHWDGVRCADQACVDAWHGAKTAAVLSDVGIGVGLVALGIGAYLVFRAEPARTERLAFSVDATRAGARATLRATF